MRPPHAGDVIRQALWRTRGQSTIEFGLLTAAVVAALAVLTLYVQNCIRGSFVQAAQSHGQQFSPSNYNESRKVSIDQYLAQDNGREWVRLEYPADTGGATDALKGLPKVISGAGKFFQRSKGTTSWTGTRDATYKSQ